jgi:hypothetical protein
MGFKFGKRNTAFDSIRHTFLSPPLSIHTGVILIQLRGRSRSYPTVFHISLKTPGNPWGLSLKDCPTCTSNRYLEVRVHENSGAVNCYGCHSSGTVEWPRARDANLMSVGHKQDFWIALLPHQGPIPITWTTISQRNFACDENNAYEKEFAAVCLFLILTIW